MNDREYLARLESASADELSQILRRPSAGEERLLALYFGEERLARLRKLALGAQRRGAKRGNVVVLHGIMGGELTVYPPGKREQHIWLHFPRLIIGGIGWLRITPQMTSENDVRATGILKKWYSEMLLGLAADQWNVQAFHYDWRLDLAELADALRKKIDASFNASEPVHLVAHSMGGLVSRTYILRHADRWKKGGRLIMLGTPNHGSFAIPQVITGAIDTVRKLATFDFWHDRAEVTAILNTMPGGIQMLPSPLVLPAMEKMYDPATWAGRGVTRKILDLARTSHTRLEKIVDGERMSYIAGCNKVTKAGVADWNRLDDPRGYTDSLAGDGTVPHSLSFLNQDGQRIPTCFTEVEHGALPNDAGVIAATKQILSGSSCTLPKQPPAARAAVDPAAAAEDRMAREAREEAQVQAVARRLEAQTRTRGEIPETVAADELRAEELIVRSFLTSEDAGAGAAAEPPPASTPRVVLPPPKIRIRLVRGGIEQSARLAPEADAISVGHYIGVAPQNAELALDKAISHPAAAKRLIASLQERGSIVGGLAQNFLFPDPRDPRRVIAIAGMGQPGTFRDGELTVLTQELVWMLGRAGRRHLFTVLIGAGAGNLTVPTAVHAWLRGIRRALNDAAFTAGPRLETITFVDYYAENFLQLDRALRAAVEELRKDGTLDIDYGKPSGPALKKARATAEEAAEKTAVRDLHARLDMKAPDQSREPIRLTVRRVQDTFEFSALTADASIPQRQTRIDPTLIDEANNQLPAASAFAQQDDQGHLLGRLLLPQDLRKHVVKPPTPVVAALDRSTARIHWEMLSLEPAGTSKEFRPENFLGTACGLTRQLQTTFAPLPEPPLLSGHSLRVLVVADPAEDAPLPGAQEEGEAVVRVFDRFKAVSGIAVEVVALLGPRQATRVAVLEQLINHRFDILHFAGHCSFDEADPGSCGWIFTGGTRLTADELNRVDRIPRFVFSNACESGITPEHREDRKALLAPSFAEAFFARGVANFVCTAWPVDDAAALAFAERLYAGLLGLDREEEAMHEAMAAARSEIALLGSGGLQTWGAYQHYGDPNFRIGRGPATPKPTAKKAPARRTPPAKRRRKPKKR